MATEEILDSHGIPCFYDQRDGWFTPAEQVWIQRDITQVRCQSSVHGWACTLKVDHPGPHRAGIGMAKYLSSWWPTVDMDCGPDEGC